MDGAPVFLYYSKPCCTLREKCPYSELFWSVFFHIRIEYGECGKIRTRITPNTGSFYTVVNYPLVVSYLQQCHSGINLNYLHVIIISIHIFFLHFLVQNFE